MKELFDTASNWRCYFLQTLHLSIVDAIALNIKLLIQFFQKYNFSFLCKKYIDFLEKPTTYELDFLHTIN